MERLALLIAHKGRVLGLVGVRDHHLVGVNHREAPGLDVLLLGQGEQHVQKALVHLEHLDELHDAPVGDVQLTVEAVSARVALRAVLADGGEVNRAGKLADVLAVVVDEAVGAEGVRTWYGKVVYLGYALGDLPHFQPQRPLHEMATQSSIEQLPGLRSTVPIAASRACRICSAKILSALRTGGRADVLSASGRKDLPELQSRS